MTNIATGLASRNAWLGSFITNIAILLMSVASGVVVARLFGPEGRGELAEIVFWGTTVAALGIIGVPSALAMAIARDPADHSLPANAVALSCLLAALVGLVFFPIGWALIEPTLFWPAYLFLILYLPVNFVGLTLISVDHGREHFVRYNLLKLVPQTVYGLILLFLALQVGVTPSNLANALIVGSAAVMPIRLYLERKNLHWRVSRRAMWMLLRTGASFHASAICSILLQRVDQFVLVTWFSHAELGLYAVAMTVSGVGVGLIAGATNAVLLPALSRATTLADKQRLVSLSLGMTFVAVIAVNIVMAAMIPMLMPFVFGEAFRAAVPLAVALCVAQIPLTYVSVASIALRVVGDWRSGIVAPLLGLVAFCVAAALIVPLVGAVGVAIAVFFGWAAAQLFAAHRLALKLDLRMIDCMLPPTGEVIRLLRQFMMQWRSAGAKHHL